MWPIVHIALALTLSPLLMGVIVRTKAFFGGRRGQPVLQPYFDIAKLLRKGAVYSRTTTWVFRAGPVVGLAAALLTLPLLPLGGVPALVAFPGDLVLLAYLLGLMRFATMSAALDTGSAFEGMGASREAQFSVLAEPALLLSLAAVAAHTGTLSLSTVCTGLWSPASTEWQTPVLLLVSAAVLIVLLTENARIPVDDPNTHLELTMIHEVMVLDHGGVDLGFIQYASCLKLWVTGALFIGLAVPVRTGRPEVDLLAGFAGLVVLAVAIGMIESAMARLRLLRVPHLLTGACALAAVALLLAAR